MNIWNYPKSSCDCWKCTGNEYPRDQGAMSNLGNRGCNTSPGYYNCFYNRTFRTDVEPRVQRGKTNINPQVMTSKYATDFNLVKCPNNNQCPKEQYASHDPRLVSAAHLGQILTLDTPPLDPRTKLNTLLDDDSLDKYGQNYQTYSDIKGGNIMYYIDHTIEDPLFTPNFTIPAQVDGTMYKDPMGAFKPQYNRYPIKCQNVLNPNTSHFNGSLSSLEDSLEHREDLMARQMRKHNEQRWEPRWTY